MFTPTPPRAIDPHGPLITATSPDQFDRTALWIAGVLGALVFALGSLVAIGWIRHLAWLVMAGTTYSAMQFNTAVGLAACGAAVVLAAARRRTPAAAGGLVISLLGLLTLAEHIAGWDLGIDRLVLEPFLTVSLSAPGRMAPQTALCFALVGLLLGLRAAVNGQHRDTVDGIGGFVVCAFALFVIAGHAVGVEGTYRWHDLTQMAPHTAAGFALIGAAFTALGLSRPADSGGRIRAWFPMAAMVAAVVVGGLIWQTLRGLEQAAMRRETRLSAIAIEASLRDLVDWHRRSIERMGNRWKTAGRPTEAFWRMDAEALLHDLPALEGLVWIDADRQRRWTVPASLDERLATGLRDAVPMLERLPRADRVGDSLITETDTLALSPVGFFIVVRLELDGRSDGWLSGPVDSQRVLALAARSLPNTGVRWFEREREVARAGPAPALAAEEHTVAVTGSRRWTLAVQHPATTGSYTPLLAWAAFALLGGVVGVALRQLRASHMASASLADANRLLEAEGRDRRAAQDAVAAILDSAPDAMLVVDPQGRIVRANARTDALFGYERAALLALEIEDLLPEAYRSEHRRLRAAYFRSPVVRDMGAGRSLWGRRRDGSMFAMEASLSPIGADESTRVIVSVRDVTERRALVADRLRLAAVVDSAEDAISAQTLEGKVVSWNPGAELTFGYSAVEMIGRPFDCLVPESHAAPERELLARVVAEGHAVRSESQRRCRDGRLIDVAITVSPVRDAEQHIVGTSTIARDVTAAKAAARRIAAALDEKEVLLREIHHRVKNNLAVVCSLLYLQASALGDSDASQALAESEHRVRSMAMVHEALYGSADLAAVRFDEYLRNLTRHLLDLYRDQAPHVVLVDELQPVLLGIDQAIPCGLLVNELVTNVMKHAWGSTSEPRITIACSEDDGRCSVSIEDNGRGFPAGYEAAGARTLGLRLIRSLTNQLGGTLELLPRSPGTQARLTFAIEERSPRRVDLTATTAPGRSAPGGHPASIEPPPAGAGT